MKFLTLFIGIVGLILNKFTTINSSFWFAYEPELPEEQKQSSFNEKN
ncbi:cyclic lactone autoinducer peptide [Salipaludibacillus agaradhaerens]|uniref:Cyclic lactone autoinducer peptide n=1 Tax=Salipaludibacillus agaradhaerens TaxID=76935 RepID=A0A9Q4B5D2_SALAG|nr:cyclic lactone autoinducer peptide [Salipaludibacillus agaradhaerens]MCR6098292.1 cyclic lactone autoinducer peptide [Salipaludibacillus agaradhaerens]MCR6116078.1 cyclic lactone autoinducer peptide [Salipaludibacillus agaradhaerens]